MAPLPPDDKEKPLPLQDDPLKPINGYPSVACMMGRFPDLAVFRRFRALNAKSLLYRQAELVQLELDLHRLELQDHNISPTFNSTKYASDWYWLSSEQGNQWGTIMKIRNLLKEYNDALIQQTKISTFADPDEFDLNSFRKWMTSDEGGFPVRGEDRSVWGNIMNSDPSVRPANLPDLVATQMPQDYDPFTNIIVRHCIPLYHKIFGEGHMNGQPLVEYSLGKWVKFTARITTLIACLLPTVAIAILYVIKDMRDRLLLIGAFTLVFSSALMAITTATRVDIFTATAAFSAVMVVFVNTQTNA